MFPFPDRLEALGLLAVLMMAGSGAAPLAGERPSEEALAKLGLKPVEDGPGARHRRAEVHDKIDEARQLARDWSNAIMQQRSTLSEKEYQDDHQGAHRRINQFKTELNNTNRMIAQIPRYRDRFATSLAYQQYDDLNLYKTQLQWEINQRTTFLNQLKSQPFDPKARVKVDARSGIAAKPCIRPSWTCGSWSRRPKRSTTRSSRTARSRSTWIPASARRASSSKLGPSRQFHLDVKLLEKAGEGGVARRKREPCPRPGEEDASIHGRETIVQVVGRVGRFGQPVLTAGIDREPGSSISRGAHHHDSSTGTWALGSLVLAVAAAGGGS